MDLSQSSSDLIHLKRDLAAGKVSDGGSAKVAVSLTLDGDAKPYEQAGELKFSDVTVDTGTGGVQVRALFPNPKHDLYPGLFVHARIGQGVRDQGILVPQQAVVRNADGSAMVWVVGVSDIVTPHPVTTGPAVGDKWLIETGLQAGDRVVVEGLQKVRPGAPVHAVPVPDAAAPATATPAKS